MDKTAKLIFWQRITIAVLLFAVVMLGAFADHAVTEALHGHAARKVVKDFVKVHANDKAALQAQDARLRHDEQIIRDLDTRLKQYEAKYGEIQPVREGEGVYIGRDITRNITRGVLPYR